MPGNITCSFVAILLFTRALPPRFAPCCWRTLVTRQRLHQNEPAGLPLPQEEASDQAKDKGNNASSAEGVHRYQASSGTAPINIRGGRDSTITRVEYVRFIEPTLPQEV